MNYHNITYPDQNNGDGLRVVLWLSGCSHHCKGCQNPQTWNKDSGIEFDEEAKQEVFNQLKQEYISGITFSGGDPLHKNNIDELYELILDIKEKFPEKTLWLYTGYTWDEIWDFSNKSYENIMRRQIVSLCDVLVDGKYIEQLRDISLHWCGSSNQRVVDVKKSVMCLDPYQYENEVILLDS